MPSPKKEKRGGLTLEKLASYDDVITDALVDKVNHSFACSHQDGREDNSETTY